MCICVYMYLLKWAGMGGLIKTYTFRMQFEMCLVWCYDVTFVTNTIVWWLFFFFSFLLRKFERWYLDFYGMRAGFLEQNDFLPKKIWTPKGSKTHVDCIILLLYSWCAIYLPSLYVVCDRAPSSCYACVRGALVLTGSCRYHPIKINKQEQWRFLERPW